MSRTVFLIVFILAFTQLTYAQVRATTESGNKVLLFDNGTWQYEEKPVVEVEKSGLTAAVITGVSIDVDSSRIVETEPSDLFYLPSPRLVKFFGESGGKIRCKLSCSNSLGKVKVHFMWDFPVSDSYRYFGMFKEGSIVRFTMENGAIVELVMGDESNMKRVEARNYSLISNASQPLDKMQIAALCAQPFRKIEVGWKKRPEEYEVGISRLLMETLPTVF